MSISSSDSISADTSMGEALRRRIRGVLGSRSPLYRLGSQLILLATLMSEERLDTLKILGQLIGRAGSEAEIRFRKLQAPIVIRRRTSDWGSVANNVVREEWGQFTMDREPSVVIDAGAYIGDTASYFLSRFRGAKVIALEPNPRSFELARRNLSSYRERCILMPAALWTEDGVVCLSEGELGAQVTETGMSVSAVSMPSILESLDLEMIDILKMDIEGAEYEVLASGAQSWMRRVEWILLETHGSAGTVETLKVVKNAGFACHLYRNVWYCRNGRSQEAL